MISEGIRYKVRNIIFEGNKKLTETALRDGILMKAGQPILMSIGQADTTN